MRMLKEGVKLFSITFEHKNEPIVLGDQSFECKSLTVTMECGQMSEVPWVHGIYNDGDEFLYNLAYARCVELLTENYARIQDTDGVQE